MVVGAVECRGFRNLADDSTPIADGIVVVCGRNGAGKTNLLEALYFGLTGRSFRAGNDRDMIRFGDEAAREELDPELARRRAQDLGRAYTSYGPQLDEVELRLGGRALRRFGSQGQQRVALLALQFAEREVLLGAGRSAPLMLLHQVMSEPA